MLDINSIRNTLTTNLNEEKSQGVDIDINVNVINEDNGKFNVQVHDNAVTVNDGKRECNYRRSLS